MGRVSKRTINKDLLKELEEQLTLLIASLNTKDEIKIFLDEFLTREEKVMLGKRLVLYMLIYKGLTSKQINSLLGMSYETIRWYKQIFEDKPEVFKQYIKKLIDKERGRELWEKIEKILEPLDLALRAKTDMKARARLATGDFWKR